jgi:hypothetical protein
MNLHHLRKVRRRIARRLRYIVISPRRIIRLNLNQRESNPYKFPMKTLLTNWKDILAFLAIAVVFAVLADIVTRLSVSGSDLPGLANLVGTLRGFSNFVGANLCAWMIGIAIGWPTLNRYSNDADETPQRGTLPVPGTKSGFKHGWASLTDQQRFLVFVAVACLELIAAAICFSA